MSRKKAKRQKNPAAQAHTGRSPHSNPVPDGRDGTPRVPSRLVVAAIVAALLVAGLSYAYWHEPETSSRTAEKSDDREAASKASQGTEKGGVIREKPAGETPAGMVWVPGGIFWRGSDEAIFPDAKPVHQVELDGFWLDETPVTNEQFAKFITATGYKTVAERLPDPKDFPGAPPELLVPGSIVFTPPEHEVSLEEHLQWWKYVPGASWRHPEGPESNIKDRKKHPVVHVSWEDAMAYAKWAGKRLPTEAEFEYAARGGLSRQPYAWGNELTPGGKWQANVWQGTFPVKNTEEDGYTRTSPVKTFPANGYGLYDMAGNVWQWCSDWYQPDYYQRLALSGEVVTNPPGPASSHDPLEPGLPKRVQRGGSFLCSSEYCVRYRVAGRGKGEVTSASSNVGFRCVKSQ